MFRRQVGAVAAFSNHRAGFLWQCPSRFSSVANFRAFRRSTLSSCATEYFSQQTVWISENHFVNDRQPETNQKNSPMFTSPFQNYCHRRATRSRPPESRFLGYLNMRTLAVVMFVALTVLSKTHGKDSEISRSALPKAAKTEVVIDHVSLLATSSRPQDLISVHQPSNEKGKSLSGEQ